MALSALYKNGRTPTLKELAAEFQGLLDVIGLPGHSPVTVSKTLTWGSSKNTQIATAVLTADIALALSTTGAVEGARFRVVRAATATGSFNLNVGTGPLKALAAASTWAEFSFNGTAWVLVAYGSL